MVARLDGDVKDVSEHGGARSSSPSGVLLRRRRTTAPTGLARVDAETQTEDPADRVTYAETVEEMDLEPPLTAEPAPVTAPVDAPSVVVERAPPSPVAVFVAPVPAVSCAAPTPEVEFVAPTPADSCAASPPCG